MLELLQLGVMVDGSRMCHSYADGLGVGDAGGEGAEGGCLVERGVGGR